MKWKNEIKKSNYEVVLFANMCNIEFDALTTSGEIKI